MPHRQASAIQIQAEEIVRLWRVVDTLARRTGRSPEQVAEEIDRDGYVAPHAYSHFSSTNPHFYILFAVCIIAAETLDVTYCKRVIGVA
ncbi:MAG: ATP-dependent Clp protease proteolytic subunit [bacterium]